jgi:hypothetical protein
MSFAKLGAGRAPFFLWAQPTLHLRVCCEMVTSLQCREGPVFLVGATEVTFMRMM